MINENRIHLRKWLLWVDKRKSPEDLDPIITMWQQNYENRIEFDAGVWFNQKLVGMIGFHYIDWKNKQTSIGCFLAKSAEDNGIISISIKALLYILFNKFQLNRVIIQCAETNLKADLYQSD